MWRNCQFWQRIFRVPTPLVGRGLKCYCCLRGLLVWLNQRWRSRYWWVPEPRGRQWRRPGERARPTHAQVGQGEGWVIVAEGDRADDLTVSRLGCGWPCRVYYHVCRECWGSTGLLRSSCWGILAECIKEVHLWESSRADLPGPLALAMVIFDTLHGHKVCDTLVRRASCWSSTTGPHPWAASGAGDHFNNKKINNLPNLSIWLHASTEDNVNI